MPRVIPRLVAIAFGLVLFLAGAEVVSRVMFRHVLNFDVEMWRYAREVKAVGLTPGLRFEHRPGSRARLMGVDVAINGAGLREREFAPEKPAHVVRIAVIGDSMTFGWGVPGEFVYPRQLETLLLRDRPLGAQVTFEVLNFGVGNYAVEDALAMLEHKVLACDPDLVIYGAFINDAEAPVAVSSGGGSPPSVFAVWLWGRLDALWRRLGWREDFAGYYNALYAAGGDGRSRVGVALDRMVSLTGARGVPLVVALLPELHEEEDRYFGGVRDFYRERATAAGAIYLDLNEALPKTGRRRFWVSHDDAHPNAQACAQLAGQLFRELNWPELLANRRSERKER